MRFDDIGEDPIYWCTHCGKQAAEMHKAIQEALKTRYNFAEEFKQAIDRVTGAE